MDRVRLEIAYADKVDAQAAQLAARARRGTPNIEDQLRASLQLVAGLDVLEDDAADHWRTAVGQALTGFLSSVLSTEGELAASLGSESELGTAARDELISFILSFTSRAASRDRLNFFTTNYDRLIEYACDLIGLRPVDRFVGGLSPRFRASRLDIDMHYNPPGIRGEPRYLEGVLRLTKLHGSIDWRYVGGELLRVPLGFGGPAAEDELDAYDSLIIYPNPAKDLETLEYPYAELFRDFSAALCRPNSVLVTYGYGFGDDHINRVIADMLTIPSTHLAVISYDDTGDRVESFLDHVGHHSQVSLIIGGALAEMKVLVEHLLPKPAIDVVTLRQSDLLRRRSVTTEPAPQDLGTAPEMGQ